MDSLTIIAIASALGGWGAFSYMFRRCYTHWSAWENERADNRRLTESLSLCEKQGELLQMAATAAADELRASRKSNAALAANASDLTKQLIATREHLEEADKNADDAIALASARWNQIEELQAAALVASELIAKLTEDKARLMKQVEDLRQVVIVAQKPDFIEDGTGAIIANPDK